MSFTQPPDPDQVVGQIVPDETPPPSPDDLLADLTDDDGLRDALPLQIEEEAARTIGRSWQFDFIGGRFEPGLHGAPRGTRGRGTLKNWIEKALRTEGGGRYPVYSVDYGLVGVDDVIGGPHVSAEIADLGDRVRDALTFHPRITDVINFRSDIDDDDEALFVSFAVLTDIGEEIPFSELRVG